MNTKRKKLIFWLEKFNSWEELSKTHPSGDSLWSMLGVENYTDYQGTEPPFVGFGILQQRANQTRGVDYERRMFRAVYKAGAHLGNIGSQNNIQIGYGTLWLMGNIDDGPDVDFSGKASPSSFILDTLTALKAWSDDGGFMNQGDILVDRLLTPEEIESLRWVEDPRFFVV